MESNITDNGAPTSLFAVVNSLIDRFRGLGRLRSAETLTSALRSFKRYRCNIDLTLDLIDRDIMAGYEAYLRQTGVTRNTSVEFDYYGNVILHECPICNGRGF